MMNIRTEILNRWIGCLCVVCLCVACHHNDVDDNSPKPITFLSETIGTDDVHPLGMPAAPMRAAAEDDTYGLETVGLKYFDVFVYKNINGVDSFQTVMDCYNVTYKEGTAFSTTTNTADWEYVGNTAAAGFAQTIKYWDHSAFSYRFAGITSMRPIEKDAVNGYQHGIEHHGTAPADTTFLHIQLPKVVGGNVERFTEASTGIYYSRMNVLTPTPTMSRQVNMQFVKVLSQVRIGFIFSGDISPSDVLPIQDIRFGPTDGDSIPFSSTVDILYPLTTTSLTETALARHAGSEMRDSLRFTTVNALSKDQYGGTINDSVVFSSNSYYWQGLRYINPTQYYVLPQLGRDYELHVWYRGKKHTAIVPAAYMNWKPNFQYTYIFKIVEPAHFEIIFVDAEIEEWQNGGWVIDEQHHW